MSVGKESTDELLAQWADLLRSRDGLASAFTFVARYGDQEYCCRDDWKIRDQLWALFRQDVDQEISRVEEDLRKLGVVVTRHPARERQISN